MVVKAPSSTSNLGAGFDVLGLALDVFADIVEVSFGPEKVKVEVEGVSKDRVSSDPAFNTAGLTASLILQRFNLEEGVKIKLSKGIPAGSGLGSSGASAAGTAIALNTLLDLGLSKLELVRVAAEGERVSAGAVHADNVAPSIYGGFTIIYSYKPILVQAYPPVDMTFALAVPSIEKTTEASRAILPRRVDLKDFVHNLGGACLAVAAMLKGDPESLGKAMMRDRVVEPKRAHLYKGYVEAKRAALKAGACGVTLSGAGPTAIAVVRNRKEGELVSNVMAETFQAMGVRCEGYVAKPTGGAKILST
ncbi:MAG: homoserine kinase [Candidatus Bathyarchaeia archaeon]